MREADGEIDRDLHLQSQALDEWTDDINKGAIFESAEQPHVEPARLEIAPRDTHGKRCRLAEIVGGERLVLVVADFQAVSKGALGDTSI